MGNGLLIQYARTSTLRAHDAQVRDSITIFLDILAAAAGPEDRNFYKQVLLFGRRVKYADFIANSTVGNKAA